MENTVPDALWEVMENLIPKKKAKVGRPRMDAKKCMSAVFLILKTGGQWSSIPDFFGSHKTIHGTFMKWVREGVFENIMKAVRSFYQQQNQGLDAWFAIDGSFVKAPLGGSKTGKNPTDRRKLGSKKSMVVDQRGAPLAIVIGAANVHDSKLVPATMHAFSGSYDKQKLKVMSADAAYDAKSVKRVLRKLNFVPLISINRRRSKEQPPKQSSRHRWIVERSHAWLNHFRAIKTRWARSDFAFLALCQLACSYRLFVMS